jgi:hypothetical protein
MVETDFFDSYTGVLWGILFPMPNVGMYLDLDLVITLDFCNNSRCE